jgi:hypothetical protein
MRTRIIPDLDFRDDRSMEHAEEIDRTLKALRREEKLLPTTPASSNDPLDSSTPENKA